MAGLQMNLKIIWGLNLEIKNVINSIVYKNPINMLSIGGNDGVGYGAGDAGLTINKLLLTNIGPQIIIDNTITSIIRMKAAILPRALIIEPQVILPPHFFLRLVHLQ